MNAGHQGSGTFFARARAFGSAGRVRVSVRAWWWRSDCRGGCLIVCEFAGAAPGGRAASQRGRVCNPAVHDLGYPGSVVVLAFPI